MQLSLPPKKMLSPKTVPDETMAPFVLNFHFTEGAFTIAGELLNASCLLSPRNMLYAFDSLWHLHDAAETINRKKMNLIFAIGK